MVSGERYADVTKPIRVRLESQRHQQLAQRATASRYEGDRQVVAPRFPQRRERTSTRADPEHADSRQPLQLVGVDVARAVEVRRNTVIELDARCLLDGRPQLPGLIWTGHPGGLAAFHSKAAPPAHVDEAAGAHRLEQWHRIGIPRPEAHLAESLRFGVGDRRREHGAGEALAAMRARDAQAFVPDHVWSNRPHALNTHRHALQLRGLERSSRVGEPFVENARQVVVPVPDVARDLDHALAVGSPHWPEGQLRGCQCATPERTVPPSKTSSPFSRTSSSSSIARPVASSQPSPTSARASTSASSRLAYRVTLW